MTESGQFCPGCGAPVEAERAERPPLPETAGLPRRRADALCDACYFDRFDLVEAPERLSVRVCTRCGAVYRGNRWVDVGARDYTDVAVEAVSEALAVHIDADGVAWGVEPEQVDPNTIRMHCTLSAVVRGTSVEESVEVPVRISLETCTRCGRIAGDYYAGVVQVRAAGRTPTDEEIARAREVADEVVAGMEATGDRNAFVTDATAVDAGLDVRVSTSKIANKIARRLTDEFGGSVSASETLVTEDGDGNEVYRVTYAVRLPAFVPGDVIDPGDGSGPVLVRSVHGNLKGRRLATGDEYEAPTGDLTDAARLGSRDDAAETTLVAIEDDRAVQVLDPETYQAQTVPRPDYLDPDAETVPVLKSRAGLHVLPEE